MTRRDAGPLVSARIGAEHEGGGEEAEAVGDHRRHRLDDDGDAEVGRAPDQPQRDERAPDAQPGDPQPAACLGARHGAHCAIPPRAADTPLRDRPCAADHRGSGRIQDQSPG